MHGVTTVGRGQQGRGCKESGFGTSKVCALSRVEGPGLLRLEHYWERGRQEVSVKGNVRIESFIITERTV